MYVLSEISMPQIIMNKISSSNNVGIDSPVYTRSIVVYNLDFKEDNSKELDISSIKYVGIVPRVNHKISKSSEFSSTYGKTFNPGIYFGVCGDFRKVKSFYLFNDTITSKVGIITNPFPRFDKSLSKLVKDGFARDIGCDFYNPVRKGYYMAGINIHHGPKAGSPEWNYSKGCITVEPSELKGLTKNIKYEELILYIHQTERINDSYMPRNILSLSINNIKNINNMNNAYISKLVNNYD